MGWFGEAVARRNAEIVAAGRWRQIRTLSGGGPATTVVDGRAVVQFASNDYLGLANHPAVTGAAARAAMETGAGAGASRLIVGGREVHDELEAELADRWSLLLGDRSRALLFPTGFAANLGAITAVVGAGEPARTVLFSDELNHASIIDGVRLSRSEVAVFPHADVEALAGLLAARERPHAVVVSDQVFSMDGDLADSAALAEVCASHDALLMLDVAHDVFGSLDDVSAEVVATGVELVVVGTSSKALGSLGGWVAAERPAIELMLNTARSFIFTTAPSPPDSAAALAALRILRSAEGDELRERLRANVDRLVPDHPSPIVPVMLGSEARALGVAESLLERGLLVPAIRPPTVPEGTCRLRVALSAAHTDEQLDRLAAALDDLGVELPAAPG